MASSDPDPDLKSPDTKCPRTESESEIDSEQEWELCLDHMYVQQHFGTSADELADTIFNLSLKHVTTLIPTLKKPLMQLAMVDKNEEQKSEITAEINTGLRSYLKIFYSRLEHYSDALHLYLRNCIVSVPRSVVLPSDKCQLQYKDLVKSLQSEKMVAGDSETPDLTEENTADFLTKKVANLQKMLQQKKLEKLNLENRIKQADSVINRLDAFEEKMSSVLSSFEGSLTEFVQKNIAAAIDLPVDSNDSTKLSASS